MNPLKLIALTLLTIFACQPSFPGADAASAELPNDAQRIAACTLPDGSWACSARRPQTFKASGNSPLTPVSWTVTDWWIDPANGSGTASDQNDCVSATTACLTFGEVIQHRLGTFSPRLVQPTRFHQLSSQALNTDFVFFEPYVANGGQAILLGSLIPNGAPFTPGGLTAKVRGGPGQLLTLTTVPAYVAAKNLIFNSTRSSYAFVDSVIAGPNAVMSQPIPASVITTVGIPTLSEDNTWAAGDTYQANTLPLVNLKRWHPDGGDVGAGGASTQASGGWTQFVQYADSSGTGASEYPFEGDSAINVISACQISPRIHSSANNGRGQALYIIGSDASQPVAQYGAGSTNNLAVFGGVQRSTANYTNVLLDGDAIAHGAIVFIGTSNFIGALFSDSSLTITGFTQVNPTIWGSATVAVQAGSTLRNSAANFAASLLTSGALKLGTLTTGFTSPVCSTFTLNGVTQVNVAPPGGTHFPANAPISWGLATVGGTAGTQSPYFSAAQIADQFSVKSPTAGANDVYNWCAGPASVTITAANLDTYNGLQDINTGARFSNTN